MPRPQCCRRIAHTPACAVFIPLGVPACDLEEVVLSLDECEAIRLADFEGLYQEEAAARMNVSRPTFGRILESARKKVAQVLMEAKSLRIEGGEVEMSKERTFKCPHCQHPWTMPADGGPPQGCPRCTSANIRPEKGGCQRTVQNEDGAGPASKPCCRRHGRSK